MGSFPQTFNDPVVCSFSWELKWPQEKLKTMLTQTFRVTNKEHYEMLWRFLEWTIVVKCRNKFKRIYRNLLCDA